MQKKLIEALEHNAMLCRIASETAFGRKTEMRLSDASKLMFRAADVLKKNPEMLQLLEWLDGEIDAEMGVTKRSSAFFDATKYIADEFGYRKEEEAPKPPPAHPGSR